ncbi:MAG TPA: DUF2141 domain-containing protein [Sphingomonas sp.]|jgi:uncharacterized protein (DUF2141 family)|nr:DUF2141 domain-containing protein [Sphingomonas sp.]
MARHIVFAGLLLASSAAPVQAQMLGGDAAACSLREGPAIQANIVGLKDRTGGLKLELYPANEQDFLKDDRDLIQEGKVFRRVTAAMPASGPVALCIRVPRPGRYALLFTHDRDGKNKFNFWSDGAGFVSNAKIGRSRPRVAGAIVDVMAGVTVVTIQVQYLRGLGGFAPIK